MKQAIGTGRPEGNHVAAEITPYSRGRTWSIERLFCIEIGAIRTTLNEINARVVHVGSPCMLTFKLYNLQPRPKGVNQPFLIRRGEK